MNKFYYSEGDTYFDTGGLGGEITIIGELTNKFLAELAGCYTHNCEDCITDISTTNFNCVIEENYQFGYCEIEIYYKKELIYYNTIEKNMDEKNITPTDYVEKILV